jgi:hypothetical protein
MSPEADGASTVMDLHYLPERRGDFTGPVDAAVRWLRAVRRVPLRQKPAAVLLGFTAVALASLRKLRGEAAS